MALGALSKAYSVYGASMGRRGSKGDPDTTARFYLQRVKLDSGGYDSGGAYWGFGSPLFRFESEDGEISGFFRVVGSEGPIREAAKAHVRVDYPQARFFGGGR